MKIISGIFVLFAVSVIVKGAWLAAANGIIKPIVLSCGTIFATIAQDNNISLFFDENSWLYKIWSWEKHWHYEEDH